MHIRSKQSGEYNSRLYTYVHVVYNPHAGVQSRVIFLVFDTVRNARNVARCRNNHEARAMRAMRQAHAMIFTNKRASSPTERHGERCRAHETRTHSKNRVVHGRCAVRGVTSACAFSLFSLNLRSSAVSQWMVRFAVRSIFMRRA